MTPDTWLLLIVGLAVALWVFSGFRDLRRERELGADADVPVEEPGHLRVHVFSGQFASEADLQVYCFGPPGVDAPEPINIDLPDAPLNTRFVEAGFGMDVPAMARDFFLPDVASGVLSRMEEDNALVLIFETAFDGLSYHLHDTPKLRLLGYETLDLPGWKDPPA